MGNAQPITNDKYANEKIAYLYSQGEINDELLQIYRRGEMSLTEIHKLVMEVKSNYDQNKNKNECKNKNKHK
jgi:hypothetical protein